MGCVYMLLLFDFSLEFDLTIKQKPACHIKLQNFIFFSVLSFSFSFLSFSSYSTISSFFFYQIFLFFLLYIHLSLNLFCLTSFSHYEFISFSLYSLLLPISLHLCFFVYSLSKLFYLFLPCPLFFLPSFLFPPICISLSFFLFHHIIFPYFFSSFFLNSFFPLSLFSFPLLSINFS